MRQAILAAALVAALTGCAEGEGGDLRALGDASFDVSADGGAVSPAGECSGAVTDAPYRDHVNDEEFTEPAECPTCPGAFTNVTGLDAALGSATTIAISASSPGSSRCDVYVEGEACGVVRATAAMDPDGTGLLSSTVPAFCGENIVRIVCENTAGKRVLVRRLSGTECAAGGRDLRLTLSWDETASDMELHLVRAGGRINDDVNDCTWTSCMSGQLDWGVPGQTDDDPTKDIDDTGTVGPENIYLGSAPPGVYHVYVEYWGSGPPAPVRLAVAIHETTVATLDHPSLDLHDVWHAGTVSFPEGTFTPLEEVIPCAAQWQLTSAGCDMNLPGN